jgi:hypothetical protein
LPLLSIFTRRQKAEIFTAVGYEKIIQFCRPSNLFCLPSAMAKFYLPIFVSKIGKSLSFTLLSWAVA